MAKLVLEVPAAVNMRFKVTGFHEAIKKLIQLKKSIPQHENLLKRIKKFKGIAKYKDIDGTGNEWYYQ